MAKQRCIKVLGLAKLGPLEFTHYHLRSVIQRPKTSYEMRSGQPPLMSAQMQDGQGTRLLFALRHSTQPIEVDLRVVGRTWYM